MAKSLAMVNRSVVLENWGGTVCATPTACSADFVTAEESTPTVTEPETEGAELAPLR